jgi:prophage regulatory protein
MNVLLRSTHQINLVFFIAKLLTHEFIKGAFMKTSKYTRNLLRLKDVLAVYPISRTSWYEGVKLGLYPQPLRLGKKTVAWNAQEIEAAINALNKK